MKYVLLNPKGMPEAFFDSAVNIEIPESAVAITEEEYQKLLSGSYVLFDGELIDVTYKKWENGKWVDMSQEEILQKLRADAKETVTRYTDYYFYKLAKERGDYLNMGEIEHDAKEGDKDAQFLLKVYEALWKREEEFEKEIDESSAEKLQNENILTVKKAYDQIVSQIEKEMEGSGEQGS